MTDEKRKKITQEEFDAVKGIIKFCGSLYDQIGEYVDVCCKILRNSSANEYLLDAVFAGKADFDESLINGLTSMGFDTSNLSMGG